MKTDRFLIFNLFLLLLFPACSNRPSWVLPDKKMEEVLYDITLAQAEIEHNYTLFNHHPEKKQEVLNKLLKKHKISKQQLDTSLVWYNAHLEYYFKINEQINKRYSLEMESLQEEIDEEKRIWEARSRINIFKGDRSFFLQSASQLRNTLLFRVDSINWTPGDHLDISFDVLGMDKAMKPEVRCAVFCEDTIITAKKEIEANGSFSMTMPSGITKIEHVSASIHLSDSIPNANILIRQFGIIHQQSSIENPSQDIR